MSSVMTDEEVRAWDEWFALTGDEQAIREWRAAKEVGANLTVWRNIIELNRITRVCEGKKHEQAQQGPQESSAGQATAAEPTAGELRRPGDSPGQGGGGGLVVSDAGR